jgi:hypothetical protein
MGDTVRLLDVRDPADAQHLVQDAQLAEELATRFADASRLALNGVEGHGGLIDDGRVIRGCRIRMFAAIESNHGVNAEQIQFARAHRNAVYDMAVMLLFVPLYSIGAVVAQRALKRRFGADRRVVRWLATVVVSIVVVVVGVELAGLWSTVWELTRLGNDHIGAQRLAAFERPSERHAMALVVGSVLLFWLIDLLRFEPSRDERDSSNVVALGLMLR